MANEVATLKSQVANNSTQKYGYVRMEQNGGTLGASGILFKDKFFAAGIVSAGATMVEASGRFGSEEFPMVMAGLAGKVGYNYEFLNGRFIVQPSYQMSYTFVDTISHTSSTDYEIDNGILNAVQIQPGVRLMGKLPKGWQPYVGAHIVWNAGDKTHMSANNVDLTELSVKPYAEYDFGVRKDVGDVCTGFLQAAVRHGGRTGISVQAGLTFKF